MSTSRAAPATLAKIIATIGPASERPEVVRDLISAGVHVFRLNFSHGSLDAHRARLRVIRDVAAELRQPVAVLGDLQGPKIRLGTLPDGGVLVPPSGEVALVDAITVSTDPTRPCTRLLSGYAGLGARVQPGQRVLINDGAIRLSAIDRAPNDDSSVLRCRIELGGLATSNKGINLPDTDLGVSPITARDWECVEWAVAYGVDFLALSFVQSGDEIRELKRALAGMCPLDFATDHTGVGSFIPVIAKIEKPRALNNLDDIFDAADAIMVARGDLGVEMDLAEVPHVQRLLLEKADEWGKPSIVATQMLETMIESSTPTRAEVSDVASAVRDGADAVMLSAETAVGKHPALVVETMRRVIAATERHLMQRDDAPTPPARLIKSKYRTAALAHGAFHVAHDYGARVVACWSQEGGTARYLSQTGIRVPIVAYTSDARQVRRMALLRGVTPRLMEVPDPPSLAEFNRRVDADLQRIGWVLPSDPIVLVAGRPLGTRGATTALAVHTVANPLSGFMQDQG